MKQILVVMCVVLLVLLITGCGNPKVIRAQKEAQEVKYRQNKVNEVVCNIQYIKDPRTGLCFAYYWGGMANGGPALATVPCDSIPPHLLIVAKVAK